MTERPVRIGVQIAPEHVPYSVIRDALTELEDIGVDIAFNWDHFFPLDGDPDGLHYESWTMLGAWAEQTTSIEFGPLVSCNSYRNPNLLADMARTVDHISAGADGVGRLVFGIGSGWFERDYTEYGYEFGTAGQRLDALAEALPVIRERWSRLNPQPTRRMPILIGGGGEKKTLKIVAEHADIWHSFSHVETLQRKLVILREWCDRVGRSFDDIEISVGVPTTRTAELGDREALESQLALGARLFTADLKGPEIDMRQVRALIGWRNVINGG